MSVAYTKCFQVPFGFLARPNRVMCVLKNATKWREISREENARVLSVEPFSY